MLNMLITVVVCNPSSWNTNWQKGRKSKQQLYIRKRWKKACKTTRSIKLYGVLCTHGRSKTWIPIDLSFLYAFQTGFYELQICIDYLLDFWFLQNVQEVFEEVCRVVLHPKPTNRGSIVARGFLCCPCNENP